MSEGAYLFERFPSFGQTFCYREVHELERQGLKADIYSIRRPTDEPDQEWDPELVRRVHYLPEESVLVPEIDRALRQGNISSETRQAIEEWGRKPDFLRLYQAVYVGTRLKRDGVRHLHAHFAGMAARTAFWINQFFGMAFSFTAHANDIFAPRDFFISLEKLVAGAATVVTVSDYAVRFLQERFPASASKICRVYNGMDFSRFRITNGGGEVPKIISIGRLIEKKGFPDLISACQFLRNAGRDFSCEIIGEGPLAATLQSRIDAGRLQDCVTLVGPQTETQVAARLAQATVFVLPCVREAGGGMDNLPTVIMEAMAAGLPVISTPLGGIPEMVDHDRTGELVPEHAPASISAAIERFIDHPELAREFGRRGREKAEKMFSVEMSARTLGDVFREV